MIEIAFPGTGLVEKHSLPECGWPAGAYFFREDGGPWQPIPGRTWDKKTRRGTIAEEPGVFRVRMLERDQDVSYMGDRL